MPAGKAVLHEKQRFSVTQNDTQPIESLGESARFRRARRMRAHPNAKPVRSIQAGSALRPDCSRRQEQPASVLGSQRARSPSASIDAEIV